MIFLLNTELVLSEILELALLNVSKALDVPKSKVRISLNFSDGKLVPDFRVDKDFSDVLEQQKAEEAIRAIWLENMKPELTTRFRGLKERRYVDRRDKASEAASNPSAEG